MLRRPLLSVVFCFIFSGSAGAQAPASPQTSAQQQSQPIRVSVERVNVGISVTDSAGQFVENLRRENFHIFDNGVEQPITDFLDVEDPAQTLMLIEAGPAVYLLEGGHLQAAHAFLRGLSPDDRVAVVKYADAPQALLDFTADKQSAAAAFDNLSFNLGFGSLNLSASLSKVLDWLAAVQGKKSIVLLSTGVDTSSEEEIRQLLERVKTSDVRILAVSLTGNLRNPPPTPGNKKKTPPPAKAAITSQQFAEADLLLRTIAESTGGQAYLPSNVKEMNAVFERIAQIVRHEFSLAFVPPLQDGAIHSLEVRVTTDAPASSPLRVDYRRAYLAPSAPNP